MVAQEIVLSDPVLNMGVQIAKRGARDVSERTGDGTTTTLLITRGALREGRKLLSAGWEPQDLGRVIESLLPTFLERLESLALEPDREILFSIARSSSRGDETIAEKVTEAVMACGEGGTVLVLSGESTGIDLEIRDGLKLDRGWVSNEMGQGQIERVLEGCLVALVAHPISTLEDITPILEEAGSRGCPVLVVSMGLWGQALSTMLVNDRGGVVSSAGINIPMRGSSLDALDQMMDLAALTGGTVLDPNLGMTLKSFDSVWFGTARKVTLTKDTCTFWAYPEHEEGLGKRIAELRGRANRAGVESHYDQDQLLERAASLDGGLILLKVGGFTESEAKERRGRVEDAVRATQCALRGVVPGAGVSLLFLLEACPPTLTGRVIQEALREPFSVLCRTNNAVPFNPECRNSPWVAYDPIQRLVRDFREAPQVMDPLEVVWDALKTGLSSAMSILSCGAVIHD